MRILSKSVCYLMVVYSVGILNLYKLYVIYSGVFTGKIHTILSSLILSINIVPFNFPDLTIHLANYE